MEYKYYRELKHNYLIVKKEGEEADGDRYRYRIAESGRIRGLIPCSERNVNGESYYYYEIGSMQTIRDRFAVSKMSFEQLGRLLQDIKNVLIELSDFLLGQEGIVFNTGNIYTDYNTGEFKLMYCPFFDEEKSFEEFAMDLLSLVDEQDQRAADLVYRLCEGSSYKGDFVYELLEECLQADAGEDEVEDEAAPTQLRPDLDDAWEDTALDENLSEPDKTSGHPGLKNSGLKRAGKRLSGKLQLLFSLMFFALLGVMVYIRMNYILSSEENMLSIFVMLVSAVTGVIALVGGFREMKVARNYAEDNLESGIGKDVISGNGKSLKNSSDKIEKGKGGFLFKNKKEASAATTSAANSDDDFFGAGFEDFREEKTAGSRVVSFTKYQMPQTVAPAVNGNPTYGFRAATNNTHFLNLNSYSKKPIRVTGSFTKEDNFGGETIVLDQERTEGLALFSRNLDKTIRIPLDKLPITIGKMEGCVDMAVSDPSVSRIHCRFEQGSDSTICIRDLGSTNGSFKNGLRLTPQQTVTFGEGDEIRIGRVCFDCR